MRDNTKETEEFYDLFKYINVLIIFHFAIILAVLLDMACSLLDARPKCFLIGWIWDFYHCGDRLLYGKAGESVLRHQNMGYSCLAFKEISKKPDCDSFFYRPPAYLAGNSP